MSELKCKACGQDNHPHYDRKYGGYCVDCSNAGAPEKDARIAELEAEVARLRAENLSLRASLGRTEESAEPVGCPCPGACSSLKQLDRLRKVEAAGLKIIAAIAATDFHRFTDTGKIEAALLEYESLTTPNAAPAAGG